MKQIFFIILLALNIYASNYRLNSESSNSYFKAVSDVMFFGSDTIIGINKNINGSLTKKEHTLNGFVEIDGASFDTQNSKRDSHIKEILNYDKFQKISFKIDSETKSEDIVYLNGVLKLNGIEKPISIKVDKTISDNSLVYKGYTSIKYSDFNIKTPTLAGFIKKAKKSVEIGAKLVFIKE